MNITLALNTEKPPNLLVKSVVKRFLTCQWRTIKMPVIGYINTENIAKLHAKFKSFTMLKRISHFQSLIK